MLGRLCCYLVGEREMDLVPLVQNNHCQQKEHLSAKKRVRKITSNPLRLPAAETTAKEALILATVMRCALEGVSVICSLSSQVADPS